LGAIGKIMYLWWSSLTPVCWDEIGEKLLGPELVQITIDKVRVIKKRMKEVQDR
jgi:hypothetical protein